MRDMNLNLLSVHPRSVLQTWGCERTHCHPFKHLFML